MEKSVWKVCGDWHQPGGYSTLYTDEEPSNMLVVLNINYQRSTGLPKTSA